MKIEKNLSKNDYDVELEEILKNKGTISENAIVYIDSVIGNKPFASHDEKKEYVEKNNLIVAYDDEYVYICEEDTMGDWAVERKKLKHYSYLIPTPRETEELSNEDDSSEDDVVEFEVVSTKDGDISISGYVYVDELDDEHPLNFYDRNGFECGTRVPSNPYDDMSPNWEAYEKLSSAFQSDELFLQFLSDFADENKTIDRGEYNLLINDGAIFEVEYRDYHSTEWGSDYYMAFTPKFNGEKVILNEEVCFHDPYTDEKVKVKDMIYENGEYIIEIPKSYWEYPQMEGICGGTVATEIISDYKIAFKKAYDMTINHGEDY